MEPIEMKYAGKYVRVTDKTDNEISVDYIHGNMFVGGLHIIGTDQVSKLKEIKRFRVHVGSINKKIPNSGFFGKYEKIDRYLNVIALQDKKRHDQWSFLCDSKDFFISFIEDFVDGYADLDNNVNPELNRKASLTLYANEFINEAISNFDSRRIFLREILRTARSEYERKARMLNYLCMVFADEPPSNIYDRLNLPYDIKIGCPANIDIIEGIDFDVLYKKISLMLPTNIEIARKQELEAKQVKELERKRKEKIEQTKAEKEKLINLYGVGFENKEAELKKYVQSIKGEEISLVQVSKIQTEIECWIKKIKEALVEEDWGMKYVDILSEKMKLLEDMYNEYVNHFLEYNYGSLPDKKIEFLEQVRSIKSTNFNDGVDFYNKCCLIVDELTEKLKKAPFQGKNIKLSQYIKFYSLGCVLISDQLNRVNKYPLKRKHIPREELNRAMVYFYEVSTPEQAEELRRKIDYLENRKMGQIGEKEVDYALKWLDKGYIIVPKKPSMKYGQEAICIYNPDFIDEEQEYDHIVIGKQGVFIIETKNYSGKLIIDSNGNWIRIKKDGIEEGEKNPLQQLRRHEKLLKSVLSSNIPIIGLICLAHSQMIIEGVENSPVPIVKSDSLTEYIENYTINGRELTRKEMDECFKCIEGYMV